MTNSFQVCGPVLVLALLTTCLVDIVSAYTCQAYLYQHDNSGGTAWGPFDVGDYNAGSTTFTNDAVSSWKLTGTTNNDCFGYAFVDINFAGDCQHLEADGATTSTISNVGNTFNDKFSSLKIRNENDYCEITLYQHDNYGGTSYGPFAIGEFNYNQLVARGFANDAISSVKLSGSGGTYCTVTFYQDENFAGWSATITGTGSYTLTELQAAGFVNDQMSSMKVQVNDQLLEVDWEVNEYELLSESPDVLNAFELDNTASTADLTFARTFSTEKTSSWEVSFGQEVGTTVAWESEFGVPVLGVSSTLSLSITYSVSFDSSTSGSETATYEEALQVTLEPGEYVYCEWSLTEATLDVPYTATIITLDDYGQYSEEEVTGTWEGVSFYNSEITCTSTDADSLTLLQKERLQASKLAQMHQESNKLSAKAGRVVKNQHTLHSRDLKSNLQVGRSHSNGIDAVSEPSSKSEHIGHSSSLLMMMIGGVVCFILLCGLAKYWCFGKGAKKDGYQLVHDGTVQYGSTV